MEDAIRSPDDRYQKLDAKNLIAEFVGGEFADKTFVTSSFGSESAVLLDLIAEVDRSLPVVFLDTEKLFPETLEYVQTLQKLLGLSDVRVLKPAPEHVRSEDKNGDLWRLNPDACCNIRKVLPLRAFLESSDWRVWINGRKRFHGDKRANLAKVEKMGKMLKINPLADWSAERVSAVFAERRLPPHPLVALGYPSIGCKNCTHRVNVAEQAVRSGRWAKNSEKTECGIHDLGGKESKRD